MAPRLAGFLVKKNLMEVFPKSCLNNIEHLIEDIIQRRKESPEFVRNLRELLFKRQKMSFLQWLKFLTKEKR